jgi:ADP-heptose:LPS heptosyltransferase
MRSKNQPVAIVPPKASILIVLMGSLGDLVRGLCLPGEIKRNWPGATITWLVEPRWKPLVAIHPLIDEVIVFDRPRKAAGVVDLRRQLKNRRFDITLDLQRHFKSGLFSYLSGAPLRIGVHPRNAKEFNWLFNNRHIPYFSPRRPKLDHYLKFVDYLGGTLSLNPDFGISSPGQARLPDAVAAQLPEPYIVIVMGSSWISKDWVYEGYRGLIQHILADGRHGVVLVGDGSQTGPAGKLDATFRSSRLMNLTGRTSLTELTALLQKAAAATGPDSGPGHISAAVGTPYVALFGPTDPDRVAPYRCDALVVRADSDCQGCYRKGCRHREVQCMAAITPAMVMAKLDRALRSGRFV